MVFQFLKCWFYSYFRQIGKVVLYDNGPSPDLSQELRLTEATGGLHSIAFGQDRIPSRMWIYGIS
ncbi:hypothetical protein NW849_04995 [Synechococcus sp. R55.3]|jgi:hypothetical protein|uniref:hypothetical protein n=1 Tax=Synechococcus sp. R55.3 TaxID=2969647 RepID=UPI0039C38FB9